MSSHQFVNPYNFIPLSAKRADPPEENGSLTGVIEYSVLTKTPLFIPNTSNDDVFQMGVEDHKSYDFFTYTDLTDSKGPAQNAMPVIPGSEIRGMFRSNYEILTNSCLSAVDDDITMGKRTNEVFQAGLLKRNADGGLDLYAAEDCLMRTKGANSLEDDWANDDAHYGRKCYIQNNLKEGTLVYFHRVPREVTTKYGKKRTIKSLAQQVSDAKKDNSDSTGYIIKGEPGPEMTDCQNRTMRQQKHCCHIFKPQNQVIKENITDSTLESVLQAYQDNGEHPYKEYVEQWKKFKDGELEEYFPVYYSKALEGQFMLSPAAITREIYNRKIKDMMGDFQPCDDKNNLCPACSLFGTVVQKGEDSFGVTSRIRFSDLACDENSAVKCYMSEITLAPLSSPKLNNMEFYLRRPDPDAVFWTYDYYIDKKGTLHPNKCGINGRKFYWHNMNMLQDLKGCDPSNQNITVRPVKAGILFHGKLYFQRLSATELNQLIYLLNAGENDHIEIQDRTHGYKLGGAKPLGLGSIAVSVKQVMLRDYVKNSDKRCVERTEYPYEQPNFDKKVDDDFTKMTCFDSVGTEKVRYPRTDKVDENGNPVIYEWFVQNHVMKGKDGTYNSNGMPTSRVEMAYAEYMEPMNSDLVSTKETGSVRFSKPSQSKKEVHKGGALKKGELYQALVIGYDEAKIFARIQIDDTEYRLYHRDTVPSSPRGEVDKRLSIGDKINVRCLETGGEKKYPRFTQFGYKLDE